MNHTHTTGETPFPGFFGNMGGSGYHLGNPHTPGFGEPQMPGFGHPQMLGLRFGQGGTPGYFGNAGTCGYGQSHTGG